MRTAKTLIRLGRCPGWSESSLGAQPFCFFVMSRLKCIWETRKKWLERNKFSADQTIVVELFRLQKNHSRSGLDFFFWFTLSYVCFQLYIDLLCPDKNAYMSPSSEFVSSSIPSWQILTAHAQPFRGARDLAFCLKVLLHSLLLWTSSGGSVETARMRRLAWTFAARICYKYQIRLTRSILKRQTIQIMRESSYSSTISSSHGQFETESLKA